jgi:hypothetical protein
MEEQRLDSIEKKLDSHGETLGEIQKTLNLLAVQNEKISSLQVQIASLWKRYDSFVDPRNGVITKITAFQASCPRGSFQTHIKWLWGTLVPLAFLQIGLAIKLLK